MNETLDLHVGRRVRWRRRILGLSQTDLARRIGVRFQQIQKYEAATNRLSAARLWQPSISSPQANACSVLRSTITSVHSCSRISRTK